VTVSAGASEDAVHVTVRDEGIGIPSEDLHQLGRPFFRARNTQNRPGTGLGLSLARSILALHNGALKIDSQEGTGAAVSLILPRTRGSAPETGSDRNIVRAQS
jgi:two-component system cell cycle sensor histidine kinase PleC